MEKTLKLTKVKRMVLAVLTVSFLLGQYDPKRSCHTQAHQ